VLVAVLTVCSRAVSGLLIYAAALAVLALLRKKTGASMMPAPYTMLMEFYCFFWPMFLLAYGAIFVHWIFFVLLLLHACITLSLSPSFRFALGNIYGRMARSGLRT
jgi:hypothetical protein